MNKLPEQDEHKETAGLASPAERCVMLQEIAENLEDMAIEFQRLVDDNFWELAT